MGQGNAEDKLFQVVPTAPTRVTGWGNDWCLRMAGQKEHSKTLPESQISISEPKEPQTGQSRGKLRDQEMQGMCGCHCSMSLLIAGRSICVPAIWSTWSGWAPCHHLVSKHFVSEELFPKTCPSVLPDLQHLLSKCQLLPNHLLLAAGEPSCPQPCACSAPGIVFP